MAVNAKAMTLDQRAMESENPAVKKLTRAFLVPYNIMNDLPLAMNEQMQMRGLRILPTASYDSDGFTGWGRINKEPNAYAAQVFDHEESAYLVRQIIPMDRRLKKAPNYIADPIKTRFAIWRDHWVRDFNWKLIYNDPTQDQTVVTGLGKHEIDAPVGFARRFVDTKYNISSKLLIDAGGLNFSSTLTAANANRLLMLLGVAFARLGSNTGAGCVIYGNFLSVEMVAFAIRSLGAGAGWNTSQDAFGRTVSMIRDAKLRDIGFTIDSVTPIIPNYETAAGVIGTAGTDHFTSLYIVRYGDETFTGWQTNDLVPEDLGPSTETGAMQNYYIDWGVGLFQISGFAIARIYDLDMGLADSQL